MAFTKTFFLLTAVIVAAHGVYGSEVDDDLNALDVDTADSDDSE